MLRVVGGVVTSALLIAGLASCTSDADPETTIDASENVAVEPDEVVRHEAAPGTPIAFGIDVPDGSVQVGPLIRQRRLDVEKVIQDTQGRAEAFRNDEDGQDPPPVTHDPAEPAPPDFTTALLRVDEDPSEVFQNTLEEVADALPDSQIDPEKWAEHCTVMDGVYTGCAVEVTGKTEDDEHVSVELTVDPGRAKSKVATAGSLLRPVMALTIEQQEPRSDGDEDAKGDNDDGGKPDDDPDSPDADSAPGRKHSRSDGATPQADNEIGTSPKGKLGHRAESEQDRNDKGPGDKEDTGDKGDPADRDQDEADQDEADQDDPKTDKDSPDVPPTWPAMKKERPAEPGDWILTPRWKLQGNTEVILSTMSPKIAMLAVKDGADADAIARRYVRAFADEATTPKIDQVDDRNERSITYTPRNDGTGPAIAVTAVATGRGNYIELLFAPDPTNDEDKAGKRDRGSDKAKRGHKKAAKRTKSNTG